MVLGIGVSTKPRDYADVDSTCKETAFFVAYPVKKKQDASGSLSSPRQESMPIENNQQRTRTAHLCYGCVQNGGDFGLPDFWNSIMLDECSPGMNVAEAFHTTT